MIELLLGLPEEQRHGWSYLSKSSSTSLETLLDVIRHTAAGKSVIDPALIDRSRARPGTPVSSLTRRQFEILRMVARGLSNQAIADEIGIAANSVVNHLSSIYSALGIAEGSNARVSAVLEFLSDTARAS
jgi:DNA-binding NarL/FixJ family response regulator